MRLRRTTVWIAGSVLTVMFVAEPGRADPQPAKESDCRQLPQRGQLVLQRALDAWAWVSRDVLGLGATPLPWVVILDEACSWHLSPDSTLTSSMTPADAGLSFDGERLRVLAAPHAGTLKLPNGVTVGGRPTASTSVYGDGSRAFSVISELGVWRRDPRHANDPRLEEFYQGLVLHELTHTAQLVGVSRRLLTIRETLRLPSGVDDDIVQKRFSHLSRFRDAVDQERQALYQAADARDAATRRQLTARALKTARERRARFFKGISAGYGELEDIFFAMEGISQLAVYRWARSRVWPNSSDSAVIDFVRGDRRYWSQDEGLALFLLIDALVPNWQARVLGDNVVSPFELLEEAIGQ